MTKLLNQSLKQFAAYAGLVLVCSIPVYYLIISRLWQYELDEHKIVLTNEAGREDKYLIIIVVTILTVIFFALLLTGFILLNRRISKHLWRTFYNSLEKIRKFEITQHTKVIFDKTNIEEFSALNQSLDKLIAGSVAAYSQQKEFTDNASHELQTPLAVIQSKLDLLIQTNPLTNEQYKIIEDVMKASARVTRINKNLLLLAKIENSQFMQKEKINLSALLPQTLAAFSNFSEDKSLEFATTIEPVVFVEGNQLLVEILINNLMTNAIRYSAANETIRLQLYPNKLILTNPGKSALHQEKLFKRFGTTSPETPGTGLGLALVKQICDRYEWTVTYTFDRGWHTFSILFNT